MLQQVLFFTLAGCQPDWIEDPQPQLDDTATEPESPETLAPPTLRISAPQSALVGHPFVLSASNSRDPEGGTLNYIWRCNNGEVSRDAAIEMVISTEQTLECDITLTSDASNLSSTETLSVDVFAPSDFADWTIMVYIAGDNNLEESGIIDINEMEAIGSSKNVNILVELDRSPSYYTGHDNWSGSRRYYITAGQNEDIESVEMADLGEIDSGSTETYVDFFTWGATAFPAEKVALIFWNHGWSWSLQNEPQTTKGIMSDDSTGNDISVAEGELVEILQRFTESTNQHIDLLGMDACTMMSWEVATAVSPWADTFVASQDYVSWDGWNYTDTLADLQDDPTIDSDNLGKSIAYRFWQTGDLSISVLDLTQLPLFNENLDTFARSVINSNTTFNYQNAVHNTYSYDGSEYGFDHDLVGFVENLTQGTNDPIVNTAAEELLTSFERVLRYNYTQEYLEGANGLSIYTPPTLDDNLDESYLSSSWSADLLWDDMLLHLQTDN